ncbi:DNA repair protein RecN [Pseudofrankia sp. DC12]|uniref:DNA repair protein RecN n=1 Tax=Pseudofrankia sp. DC12 TaxID=683315 RepID=UPI0005F84F2D|nr:DNA repair protein RecN [Pseudofrankia sp. DC12]
MLEEIRLRGLGVIDDAVLDLAPGLTVVTGETGAGKTMIVQGLGLLTGGRADYGLIRPGYDRAFVEGRLVISPDSPTAARVREAGGELDEGGVLVIGRTLISDGRSRVQVGGRAVPASLLAQLAEDLVAVHGQSEAQRLLKTSAQRAALDRFAGEAVAKPLARYGERHTRLAAVRAKLTGITERSRERAAEAESLRSRLADIERVGPSAGEDVALDTELRRLEHAEALVRAAETAHAALVADPASGDGSPGAVDMVSAARRVVSAEGDLDPALAELGTRIREAAVLLADVAADLASYAAGIDADPVRLAAAQERRADLAALTRAHGTDVDGVLAWAEEAGRRLLELDGGADSAEALVAERDALLDDLADLAGQVSSARSRAAHEFGERVAAELAGLAMPRARVVAVVSQRDDPAGLAMFGRKVAFGPGGVDDVELRLVPHPGAPARPVHKGASGGELSRVMLAIEVVLAADDAGVTMVFDEVDAGVGGRAAVEIGRRLAKLARSHQVICITHLPQVASFADRHLVVSKASDGSVTRSGVTALDDAGRVRELSRMLAGQEDSTLARGHAEELLAAAAADKATP